MEAVLTLKEKTMAPTVGRIVHVYTTDKTRQFNGVGEGPYAALVTQVFSDVCINARVFPAFGEPWETSSCMPETAPHRWAWPPRD